MMEDNLTQEELKRFLHYDPETGHFTWKVVTANRVKKGAVAGHNDVHGYISISLHSVRYRAHRLAWMYITGEWPEDQIDHINRIRNDNRFCNIRAVTQRQNMANMKNNNSFVGVWLCKTSQRWYAQLDHKHVGCFVTHYAACYARWAAELAI